MNFLGTSDDDTSRESVPTCIPSPCGSGIVHHLIYIECEGVSSNPTMLGEQMKKWPRKAKPYSSKKIMA